MYWWEKKRKECPSVSFLSAKKKERKKERKKEKS